MSKVLFLIDSLELGGAERQMTLLIKYLPASWKAEVISFDGGMFFEEIKALNIPLTVLKRRFRYDLFPVIQLIHRLIKNRPNIVHTWGWMSSAIAAPLCKMLGIKFLNGAIRRGYAPRKKTLRSKISFFLADFIVANSIAGLKAFKIPRNKGIVIYNAFDPQRLNQKVDCIPHNILTTTVVMAARMEVQKDFFTFIEAAKVISAKQDGRWKFIAVGDGSLKQNLIFQASDLMDKGVVEFPGLVKDVWPYLKIADIGVLLTGSTHKEGLSNSIMEYMASGLPVICTDGGGNQELVNLGETGLIIDTENVDQLVESLYWLRNHPQEANLFGIKGKLKIAEMCSVDRMVVQYVNLYEKLLE